MPLPEPRRNEDKNDFIGRCMSELSEDEEFKDNRQRRAVCERQWKEERGMKTIAIDGIIGWDVTASMVRDALADANGDDVELLISSPGGSVYEGLAIYNAIRDYRRAGGKATARVVGLAASMSTYIPLAAESVAVEDNAIWMIHNPAIFAMGDQRAMRKAAEVLDGITGILAAGYERKTGKVRAEIRAMMDDETFLYGEAIVEQGFADAVVESESDSGADNEEDAVAYARMAVDEMLAKLKAEPEREQLDRVAALLTTSEPTAQHTTGVAGEKTAAKAGTQEEGVMDLKTLKKEHPDVFAEAVAVGVEQERGRAAQLLETAASDPDNAKLQEIVAEAVSSGRSLADVQARVNVAIRDYKRDEAETPPEVATAQHDTASGEDDEQADDEKIVESVMASIRSLPA